MYEDAAGNHHNWYHAARPDSLPSCQAAQRRGLDVFCPEQHYERFNQLENYRVLAPVSQPIADRYQGGRGYPYIGASSAPPHHALHMHPPDDAERAVCCAFVCPAAGLYFLTSLSINLVVGDRAKGPVFLDVHVHRAAESGGGPAVALRRGSAAGAGARCTHFPYKPLRAHCMVT